MTEFYLVQRMKKKAQAWERDKGLDREFDLEYMGSSEFEWGAVPKALRRLREDKVIVTQRVLSRQGGRTVHFVTHAKDADRKWNQFEKWVAGGMQGKEWSNFDTALEGRSEPWQADTWWSIDSDAAWSLEAAHANAFAAAVNNPPAK